MNCSEISQFTTGKSNQINYEAPLYPNTINILNLDPSDKVIAICSSFDNFTKTNHFCVPRTSEQGMLPETIAPGS